MRLVLTLLSYRARKLARQLGVRYSFLFMRADGSQLAEITRLVEAGVIVPVTDTTFPFTDLNAALDQLDTGRAKGKIVVDLSG